MFRLQRGSTEVGTDTAGIASRKISATLLEFGEPLLDLLEAPSVEEFRAALNIVIVVWNAHGLAMAIGGGPSKHLEALALYRRRIAQPGAPAGILVGFDALNGRRVLEYGDDPRCVGEWKLLPDGKGGYKFRCDARLPVGSG